MSDRLIFNVSQVDRHGNVRSPTICLLQRSVSMPEKLKRCKSSKDSRHLKRNRSGTFGSGTTKCQISKKKYAFSKDFGESKELCTSDIFGQYLYISETHFEECDQTDVEDSQSTADNSPRESNSPDKFMKSGGKNFEELSFSHINSDGDKSLSQLLDEYAMQFCAPHSLLSEPLEKT